MTKLPVLLPAPGDVRTRDGYSISVRSTGMPMFSVARWSDELEAMLTGVSTFAISIAGSVEGVFEALPRLVPFAPRILGFSVPDGVRGDFSVINAFTRLEELSVHGKLKGVALSSFPRLRLCLLDGGWDLAQLSGASGLEELHLEGSKAVTLEAIAPLRGLRRLYLWTMSRLESLSGIEQLPLETLKIHHARALRSVAAAASVRTLRELSLDATRAVADLESLGEATSLEDLTLIGAGSMSSFEWLASLPKLRELHVEGTAVTAAPASLEPLSVLRSLEVLRLRSGLEHASHLEAVGDLHNLRLLVLQGLKSIPSLRFLRALEQLTYLGVDAPVEDGDLSPLAELPSLTKFDLGRSRKHYKPTIAEVQATIAERHPHLRVEQEERRRFRETRGHNPYETTASTGAAEAPVAAAPGESRAASDAGTTAQPGSIMRDVPWRFDYAAPSRAALVEMLDREMREEETGKSWNPQELVLSATRLRVRAPGFGDLAEAEGAEVDSDDAVFDLTSESPAGFTAADLLYKLHAAVAPVVGDTDYRYFEGLVLLDSDATDGVPVYELRLGS